MVNCDYPTAADGGETMTEQFAAPRPAITGLILAGGAGRRVGNRDKGLLEWRGETLVGHVYARISPQVDSIVISCNRNENRYRQLTSRVLADEREDFQGPLAGLESALLHIESDLLAIVPCDSPLLPPDLVTRLLQSLLEHERNEVSYAHAEGRDHYLCAVVRRSTLPSLSAYLNAGGRSVRHWYERLESVVVPFEGAGEAFLNINQLSTAGDQAPTP